MADGGPEDDLLAGTSNGEVIAGNGGNDLIFGLGGNDILYGDRSDFLRPETDSDELRGGDGNDVAVGGLGDDLLYGDDGDDRLYGGFNYSSRPSLTGRDGGNDTFFGGAGTDLAVLVMRRTAGVTVDIRAPAVLTAILDGTTQIGTISGVERLEFTGGDGADTVFGGALNDWVSSGGGADLLVGGDGDDQLFGDAGSDDLSGGAANDVVAGGVGDDRIDGGDGTDTLVVTATTGVTVDLSIGQSSGEGNDTIIAIESVRATGSGNDLLIGDGSANVLTFEGGGDDHARGMAGNDILSASSAATLEGGDGDDRLVFASANGRADGGAGNDVIVLLQSNDVVIDAGAGDDTIERGYGQSSGAITLGQGVDTIRFAGKPAGTTATVFSNMVLTDFDVGSGGDRIATDTVYRIPNDLPDLYPTDPDPFLSGHLRLTQIGADTVLQHDRDSSGFYYSDHFGEGYANIYRFVDLITFKNTDARDLTAENLGGFSPNTIAYGAASNDFIVASGENYVIAAQDGDDRIYAGPSAGFVDGGAGDDTLLFYLGTPSRGSAPFPINMFGTTQTVLVTSLAFSLNHSRIETHFTDIEVIFISSVGSTKPFDVDVRTFGGSAQLAFGDQADTARGTANADRINGGGGSDILYGNDGDDLLSGGAGTDLLQGGADDDLYLVDDIGDATVETADVGLDTVIAAIDWTLSANVENLQLGGGARSGTGNASNNRITGSGGHDTIRGQDGDDMLFGMTGNDTIGGGGGADTLTGGAGRDVLTGGAGADTFRFVDGDLGATNAQADTIVDFDRAAGDRINLRFVDADVLSAGDQAFRFIGTAAFSGTPGELRYFVAAGDVFLQMNVDGDASADHVLRLTGSTAPIAADFVL